MSNDKQSVRFFDFSKFHGKNMQGSTQIRVEQVIKYWDEADLYKYGEKCDVLIFQKVYVMADFQVPVKYPAIKILDVCDPDWLHSWIHIVQTCNTMDAVTCPTEHMAKFLRQFHNNVHVVPDRFDLELIPYPKKHEGDAKTVVWFGYSHNAELLKAAMPTIDAMKLNLVIISNEDPYVDRWSVRKREEYYTFKKYQDDTIYQELQKADYAVLPDGYRPQDLFKSNNKAIKANLAGLPVAKSIEDMQLYSSADERNLWVQTNYGNVCEEYDVKKSVEQYKEIINNLGELG